MERGSAREPRQVNSVETSWNFSWGQKEIRRLKQSVLSLKLVGAVHPSQFQLNNYKEEQSSLRLYSQVEKEKKNTDGEEGTKDL